MEMDRSVFDACKHLSVADYLLTQRLAKAVYEYNNITGSSINVLSRWRGCFFDYRAHKALIKTEFPSSMPQECTSLGVCLTLRRCGKEAVESVTTPTSTCDSQKHHKIYLSLKSTFMPPFDLMWEFFFSNHGSINISASTQSNQESKHLIYFSLFVLF